MYFEGDWKMRSVRLSGLGMVAGEEDREEKGPCVDLYHDKTWTEINNVISSCNIVPADALSSGSLTSDDAS